MRVRNVLLGLLLFFPACQQQQSGEIHVASTPKYLFGFDEDGHVVWKKAEPGYAVGATTQDLFLAMRYDSGFVRVGERKTGRTLWERRLDGMLARHGFTVDSLGRSVLVLSVEGPKQIDHFRFASRTGEVLEHTTEPKEPREAAPMLGACPVPPPGYRRICVAHSSRAVFGFNDDAELLWRFPFPAGVRMLGTGLTKVVVAGGTEVAVLERESGKLVWKRRLPSEIRSFSMLRRGLRVGLADGTSKWLDRRTGAEIEPDSATTGAASASTGQAR